MKVVKKTVVELSRMGNFDDCGVVINPPYDISDNDSPRTKSVYHYHAQFFG